jgi:two-component system sensor histidine kinase BaeS
VNGLTRRLASLRARLLLSHLLVVVVGLTTLFVTASLIGTNFFQQHVAHVHGLGLSPMGSGGMPGEMNAELNDAFRRSLTQALLIAGIAALGVAVIASFIVSRQVAQPLARLVVAMRRIAAGHHAEGVPATSMGEVGELATRFNEMAAALASTEQRRLDLIGDVAHELRTPIATLTGYLEGLEDGVIEPSLRTWATLQAETSRLNRLVEDLQELSRAEAHQLSLLPRRVAPATLVQAAVDRLRTDIAAKGLTLQVEVWPTLPAVQADPDRVIQVLTNLLANAVRYTPAPGEIALTVTAVDTAVRFRVRDTGIGAAPEHLPHLFERFYRVDKSRSRALGGSGIGLTISKALVEAMGGRIWVESSGEGQGASFSFELPVAPSTDRP